MSYLADLLQTAKTKWQDFTRCDGKGCPMCQMSLGCEDQSYYFKIEAERVAAMPIEERQALERFLRFEDEDEPINFLDIEI